MPTSTCPSCGGSLIDYADYTMCEDCETHTDTGYHRDVAQCNITLLPINTCSHCTKPQGTKWIEKEVAPGYSAPIRYIGDDTVPSLEAFPPPLPALAINDKDAPPSEQWGATTFIVRPVGRPKGYHWRVSGRPGGYVEGGWMDKERPDVDLLDQPIEDTWL